MQIVAKGKDGPFVIVEDGANLRSIPDFGIAVEYALDTLKRSMRKPDSIEVSYRYKPGTKAIGFHVEENWHYSGYRIVPKAGEKPAHTPALETLNSVWHYCIDTANGAPFKIFLAPRQ